MNNLAKGKALVIECNLYFIQVIGDDNKRPNNV